MRKFQYKTNINCGGCVKAVSGFLNEEPQIRHWSVDTENPDKILSVETEELESIQIEELVKEAGFEISPIQ